MNQNLADITFVLDRSGSMSSCKADAEGGLNTFIDEQKSHPGEATFTLVQFDTNYEFVHRAIPIKDVPKCTLNPRGNTALLDAVGRAITETGERLAAIDEAIRPGLVVFVILTDGEENSSREFTRDAVRSLITEQTEKYKWQFVFLGANADAFAQAASLGVPTANAAQYSEEKTSGAFSATSSNLRMARTANARGLAPSLAYSDNDRSAIK